MQRAKFEKVSYPQYQKAMASFDPMLTDDDIKAIYDSIRLPQRATTGSAGLSFPAKISANRFYIGLII